MYLLQPIKARGTYFCPADIPFLSAHHSHDTHRWHSGFSLSIGLKWRRQEKHPLLLSTRQVWLPTRMKCWSSTCGLQARSQLKEARGAYISKHFAQSSAGPSANPSKVATPLGKFGIVQWGWWWWYCLRRLNGFANKPVSLAMLKLISSDASQRALAVLWNSLQKGKNWGIKTRKWINILQYYSILHAFNVILNWLLHNITQYYMDITILFNIACTLGSIQFNDTEY